MSRSALIQECQSMGLDPELIAMHLDRFATWRTKGGHTLATSDACRLDNGGILRLPKNASFSRDVAKGFAAFVPAAGAATRYVAPLHALAKALSGGNQVDIERSAADLITAGAETWPLPASVLELIQNPQKEQSAKTLKALAAQLRLPKALMPCVAGGPSFLQIKSIEHAAIGAFEGEAWVAPAWSAKAFEDVCRNFDTPARLSGKSVVFEQGPELCTIRLTMDGEPVREHNGKLSLVSAGHGALVSLFPKTQRIFPNAHSLFIRNIDNVNGTADETLVATRKFLATHTTILEMVRMARSYLHNESCDLQLLMNKMQSVLKLSDHERVDAPDFAPQASAHKVQSVTDSPSRDSIDALLWIIQARIFHNSTGQRDRATLQALYNRPVNTLGQVPNLGADVGGSPVFLDPKGAASTGLKFSPIKVCLELPHASQETVSSLLTDAAKTTHFNPVFAAAEIPDDHTCYTNVSHPFWLISKKSWRGEDVCYHESLLFELIGNNGMGNVTFVEIPRRLFNPHKTLADGARHNLADWLSHKSIP